MLTSTALASKQENYIFPKSKIYQHSKESDSALIKHSTEICCHKICRCATQTKTNIFLLTRLAQKKIVNSGAQVGLIHEIQNFKNLVTLPLKHFLNISHFCVHLDEHWTVNITYSDKISTFKSVLRIQNDLLWIWIQLWIFRVPDPIQPILFKHIWKLLNNT